MLQREGDLLDRRAIHGRLPPRTRPILDGAKRDAIRHLGKRLAAYYVNVKFWRSFACPAKRGMIWLIQPGRIGMLARTEKYRCIECGLAYGEPAFWLHGGRIENGPAYWTDRGMLCSPQCSLAHHRKRAGGRHAAASAGAQSVRALSRAASADQRSLLPLHRPPADVVAAEAVGPVDPADRRIGPALRLGHRLAGGGDVQHAPAIGDELAVLQRRAGMEDLRAVLPRQPRCRRSACPFPACRDSPWPP